MADFRELVACEKPVLIDFFAEWCSPCKTLSPIFKKVAKEMILEETIGNQKTKRIKTIAFKLTN